MFLSFCPFYYGVGGFFPANFEKKVSAAVTCILRSRRKRGVLHNNSVRVTKTTFTGGEEKVEVRKGREVICVSGSRHKFIYLYFIFFFGCVRVVFCEWIRQ